MCRTPSLSQISGTFKFHIFSPETTVSPITLAKAISQGSHHDLNSPFDILKIPGSSRNISATKF